MHSLVAQLVAFELDPFGYEHYRRRDWQSNWLRDACGIGIRQVEKEDQPVGFLVGRHGKAIIGRHDRCAILRNIEAHVLRAFGHFDEGDVGAIRIDDYGLVAGIGERIHFDDL